MQRNSTEIQKRADALYGAREQTENVRASLEILEAAAEDDFEAGWRMGRALFFLGQEEQRRESARLLHARAVSFCMSATALQPSRVEGHFWLGVNLALQAQGSSLLKALPLALRARRSLRRAAHINPAYHGAGPLRVLARLEEKLPRWLGGGHVRARASYTQAIAIAPANTVTRLYFAEMLRDAGDESGAQRELLALLEAPLDAAWAFETMRDRRLAHEMLERMRPLR